MKCCEFTVDLEADPLKDPGTYEGATTNRKCTDIIPLILTLLYFGLVVGLTTYCSIDSDIDKYLKGYDDCGNICGRNNTKTQSIPFECYGKNMLGTTTFIANDPIKGAERRCTSNCSFERIYMFEWNYCWQNGSDASLMPLHRYVEGMSLVLSVPIIVGIICIAIMHNCVINKNEFRYSLLYNHCVQIGILVLTLLIGIIRFPDNLRNLYFEFYVLLIILAVISIIYLLFICPFYRTSRMKVKIELTVELFKETRKILKELKFTCIFPLVTFITIYVILYDLSWCNVCISTYSYLDEVGESITGEKNYDYIPYALTIATKVLLICTALFLYEFIRNVQFMLISGTVAQWYFTQNKTDLKSPFKKTAINIIEKHLGTLFFCSFILTITIPIQILLNFLSLILCLTTYKQTKLKFFRQNSSENCYRILNGVLTYLTRNGLTMTAIHGLNFCAATTRASKLLAQNQFNIATIFNFGDWIFVVVKFSTCCLITILPGGPNEEDCLALSMYNLILQLVAYIWICVLHDCYSSVKLVTQYTLFLCFCEDCLYNNATAHMTPELAKIIENVNVFVDGDYWKTVEDKWAQGPKKLY